MEEALESHVPMYHLPIIPVCERKKQVDQKFKVIPSKFKISLPYMKIFLKIIKVK